MECMLLPKKLTSQLTKVPHIDEVRYNGKDWFSYPQQRFDDWPKVGPDYVWDLNKYINDLESSKEIAPLLQTWLFFGLLCEFFRGNASEISDEVIHWVYEKYTCKDDSCAYITTSTLLKDMEKAVLRDLSDKELFKQSCLRFRERVYIAWVVLKITPADFDPRIKACIGAVAEILSHSVNLAFSLYKLPLSCPTTWTTTYLNEEPSTYDGVPSVRQMMLSKGWCPSDISRSKNKFDSLQILHFLGKMDRSLPLRDHRQCTDTRCTAYQISNGYEVRHVDAEHECRLVHVDNTEIIRILGEGDSIPLLKFVGDIDNLEIEIVQSTKDTPYVAISHVWADGLGNQRANALNSCELIRLRTLIEALASQDASTKNPFLKGSDRKSPFVWIDTLCCPVEPEEAKKMSLRKLRNVYQDAAQVLVLDASLEAYKAGDMDLVEQLARIFTSSWLRRLWTLQEGALAESLYFQFADIAVSLDLQTLTLTQATRDIRKHLFVLNSALQYRSVSVATDEPLCIACLLSIPTTEMLGKDVSEGDRMKVLWKLIAEKYQGLPASIVFFEDTHIDERGWRWAPSSLLTAKPQFNEFVTRFLMWADKNLGQPTPNGLKVKLPGYRFILENTKDKQPWSGLTRVAETNVFFRDLESSKWYFMFDTENYFSSKTQTEEQRKHHNDQNKYPLNDLLSRVPSFLIRDTSGNIGILTSLVPPDEQLAPTDELLDGIPVHTHFHVACKEASPAQTIFMNAIEILAQELRKNSLTDQLVALGQQDTAEAKEQHAAKLQALKDEMKEVMKSAIEQRWPDLGPAIDSIWGEKWRELAWVCIGDWYYNDFKAVPVEEGQVWYVD